MSEPYPKLACLCEYQDTERKNHEPRGYYYLRRFCPTHTQLFHRIEEMLNSDLCKVYGWNPIPGVNIIKITKEMHTMVSQRMIDETVKYR